MSSATNYSYQGLQPAHSPELSTTRGVLLPFGGPTGTGGTYAQGLALGNVGGTAQPEILTITTTGSSGTFTLFYYSGAGVSRTGALAYNVSTTLLQAALETIFGAGSLTVTGTAGSSYVITFSANARVGGNFVFANTFGSGSISIARTQRGSCGAGQYDVYDNSTVTVVDALLENETALDPAGALVFDTGVTSGPFSPPAYVEGFFFAADIPNVDAAAVTNAGTKLSLALGTAVTNAGAIVRLVQ